MMTLKNVKTQEVQTVGTKKEIAEIIANSGVTENSVATIVKKLKDAVENNEVLYETFEVSEQIEDEVDSSDEISEEDAIAHSEDQELQQEELVEQLREQLGDKVADAAEKVIQDSAPKSDEPKQDGRRNRNGKTLIAYKDGNEVERFPTIKKCAEYMKEELDLKHMPFTAIMKSARDGIDFNEWSFRFENEEDKLTPSQRKSSSDPKEDQNNESDDQENQGRKTEFEEVVENEDEEI